uniref:(northern house mosquito) hypothetical protein n=1 Tax=Culex pipiens TaxID=7175 RepID=A0A8D8J526_CULPI
MLGLIFNISQRIYHVILQGKTVSMREILREIVWKFFFVSGANLICDNGIYVELLATNVKLFITQQNIYSIIVSSCWLASSKLNDPIFLSLFLYIIVVTSPRLTSNNHHCLKQQKYLFDLLTHLVC